MTLIKNPLTIVKQEGGGSISDEVRFIDYDGTIIAQMSIAEAQALTTLPAGPVHDILSFEGWTHTLQEVNNTDHILDIGATYTYADDNSATVFIWTPTANSSLKIIIDQDASNAVKIDWGDSSAPETSAAVGSVQFLHTYTTTPSTPIKTIVSILDKNAQVSITTDSGGIKDADLVIFGKIIVNGFSMTNAKDIILSPYVDFASATGLSGFHGVNTLILPKVFGNTPNLTLNTVKTIVFPANSLSPTLQNFYSLTRLVAPDNLSSLSVMNAYSLKELVIPNPAQDFVFYQQSLLGTWSLSEFTVPKECTQLGARVFATTGISTLKFEDRSAMPAIDMRAVMATSSVRLFDFSEFKQVPTMNDTNLFAQLDTAAFKIHVPAALEASWKAAPNWGTYAANIVGV